MRKCKQESTDLEDLESGGTKVLLVDAPKVITYSAIRNTEPAAKCVDLEVDNSFRGGARKKGGKVGYRRQ